MIKIPRPNKMGPKAKGPYRFVRYLNKERLTAVLIDPYHIDQRVEKGKVTYYARTFNESTSNIAKTIVPRENYEFSPEELNNFRNEKR